MHKWIKNTYKHTKMSIDTHKMHINKQKQSKTSQKNTSEINLYSFFKFYKHFLRTRKFNKNFKNMHKWIKNAYKHTKLSIDSHKIRINKSKNTSKINLYSFFQFGKKNSKTWKFYEKLKKHA